MTAYNLGAFAADVVFLVVLAGIVAGIVFLVKARANAANPPAAAPNWYPDPADPQLLRYHDGQAWTAATRPRAAPPPS